MDEDGIRAYITTNFEGVVAQVASAEDGSPEIAWGDTFFFYDPDAREDGRRFPFATIITKDYGDFDNASNLNREAVFRLNISLGPDSYNSRFGIPAGHDFTALDRVMPHPIYGAQHWVSVLNPSDETFESIHPLLAEAHSRAARRYRAPGD